ncbi:Isochorismatase hydrolase [Calocera cornea HHB12733]|uniref:Isochorismatase hydrolase n=1 Tax=Calocera cornea HHB12733 TaxID=1353952 RepID=A0A165IH69_9BASI|nr:Isochorismatase hydrolase [Calocera cornea HHB12733]
MGEVRPKVAHPTAYGGQAPHTQWHEYPSGLIDLSRPAGGISSSPTGPPLEEGSGCFELRVEGQRRVRVSARAAALVVVDMQNFFLLPSLCAHPQGLACVSPILTVARHLRSMGVRIVWLNWGLDERSSVPPALEREFKLTARAAGAASAGPGPGPAAAAGFGADLGPALGKLLYKREPNSQLYGPLQAEYEGNSAQDWWVVKERMSGLWGDGGELASRLDAEGRRTLFFARVNADQSVSSTIVDAFALGYDVLALSDCIGTTSPGKAKDQIMFNMLHEYGFVTDSETVAGTKLA